MEHFAGAGDRVFASRLFFQERRALFVVLVLVPALALSGCGGPEVVYEPPRVAVPSEEAPVSQISSGGTARILLPGKPACLNPYLDKCAGAEALTGIVFEAPLAGAQNLKRRPLLAEETPSFEAGTVILDPFTVEIRLRAGIVFSDGHPLSSADVEWTYEQAAALRDISPEYSGFRLLSHVETPDERTARLVFREPYALWKELLTAPILPRHVYDDGDLPRFASGDDLVGSGPFLLSGRSAESLDFAANPGYWVRKEPQLPNLDRLEVLFGSSKKALQTLSEGRPGSGAVLAEPDVVVEGGLRYAAAAPIRVEMLLLNSRRLSNRELREGVASALDREELAETAGGPVARSFVPPRHVPGYLPAFENLEPPSDVPPSAVLDFVYPSSGGEDSQREAIAHDIVENLSAAGVEAEARAVPQAEFPALLKSRSYDLALFAGGEPSGYGTLLPALPPLTAAALEETLAAVTVEEWIAALEETQLQASEESALVPLFVWPYAFAWSSDLSGPMPGVAVEDLMGNVREWGIYK